METSSYFSILQRRWPLVLACLLVGLVAGLILTPSHPKGTGHGWTSKVDIIPAAGSPTTFSLAPVKLVASGGDVARAAAKTLNSNDPSLLASEVTTSIDNTLGVLSVTAKAPSRTQSDALATAWAHATGDVFASTERSQRQAQADAMQSTLDHLKADVDSLDQKVAKSVPGAQATLNAQFQAESTQYQQLLTQQEALANPLNDPAVTVLDNLTSTPDSTSSILATTSRPLRLGLAAALGLALGLIAALMVDRMDTRLRGRLAVEEAFGLPVLAEVPRAPRRHRAGHAVLVASRPGSPVAEAYRSLRSALLLAGPPGLAFRLGQDMRGRRSTSLPARAVSEPAPVVLVVSPKPQDGRSSTVANLAAALAETGRSVLVLDCDFRHPETHMFLGTGSGVGMSELLLADRETDVTDVIRSSQIPNIRLVTGGAPTGYPAALLPHVGDVVAQARFQADVVLLDSSPLLFANDTNDLIQHADTLLVVARSGNLTAEQAARVGELLTRTGVPVAGIALVGVDPSGTAAGSRRGLGARLGPNPSSGLRLGRSRRAAGALEGGADAERATPSWARRGELDTAVPFATPDADEAADDGDLGTAQLRAWTPPAPRPEPEAPTTNLEFGLDLDDGFGPMFDLPGSADGPAHDGHGPGRRRPGTEDLP